MDTPTALIVLYLAGSLLGLLLVALFWYWVIRLAVTHGMRSHSYWLQRQRSGSARSEGPAETGSVATSSAR